MPRSLLYISLFLGMLLVALLFMPLRLAADMAGLEDSNFSAKKISGSIWNGRIDSAKLGAISLGDFDASMQFLPLLAGAAKFDIARDDSEFQSGISATIGKDGNMLLVEDLTTTFRVGQQLAPLPASLLAPGFRPLAPGSWLMALALALALTPAYSSPRLS